MISTRLTSLIVLLAAACCFGCALWTTVYEARIYLAFLGLLFLICGILVELTSLLLHHEQRDYQRRYRRTR